MNDEHTPRPRKAPIMVGQTVLGRYQLVRLLGDGGMGSVYKAADPVLRRFVAIKLLHAATSENPSAVERFVREARSAAAIGHPNIIDIIDFDYADGRPVLVMEYLRGRALSELIAQEKKISIPRACSIATHALAGLAAAHQRNILHRDLKPANLMLIAMLGDPDFVKVCDFGFAALLTPSFRIEDGKTLTPARTLVGTPAYAAPERLRGDESRDPRVDIYAIGVVLFEMIAGRRPFEAKNFRDLAKKVRKDPPPKLRSIRPEVSPGLEAVIEKALSKEKEMRFASADEFAAALVPYGGREVPKQSLPDDSFTMDLLRIRARERETVDEDAEDLAAIRGMVHGGREDFSLSIDVEVESDLSPPTIALPRKSPAVEAFVRQEFPPADTSPSLLTSGPSAIGAMAVALLQYVAQRFGERAVTDLLASLTGDAKKVFSRGISASQYVPVDALAAVASYIDARLGRDDLHLVVQCGRAAAESVFERIKQIAPPSPPPKVLLQGLPRLFLEIMPGVLLRVPELGDGFGRVEKDDQTDGQLVFDVFLIGFLERSLARFGAKDVEVTLSQSLALGDSECVYDITWLAG